MAFINVAVIIVLYVYITLPVEDSEINKKEERTENVPFQIQTNKHDLNQVIIHYVEEQQTNSPFDYQVSLDDYVNFSGTLSVFNQDIEMKVTFEPKALKNGDLILQQRSMAIGRLQLPASYVLKFVDERYQFPEWVDIQPNDETVYLNLQNMKLKSELKVKVNEFDLKNDRILFTLLVPTNKGAS